MTGAMITIGLSKGGKAEKGNSSGRNQQFSHNRCPENG
jgi:hypothetical protein